MDEENKKECGFKTILLSILCPIASPCFFCYPLDDKTYNPISMVPIPDKK
jgi:hypothetical protein